MRNYNDYSPIIELPFNGRLNTLTHNETGKIDFFDGTIDEYKQKCKGEIKVISWDEFFKLQNKFYFKPFTEISEDQYTDALECLPPLKWHNINESFNVFFCSEAYSGLFHTCYIKDRINNKFYCARIEITTPDTEMLTLLKNIKPC